MNTDDLKKVKIFAIVFNSIMALFCISIRYESSGAFAFLHNGGLIIIVLFINVILTVVVNFLLELIYKYWNKDYTATLSYTFALAVGVGFFIFGMSIFNPKQYTDEEIQTKQLQELKQMMKKGNKMLAKSENIITDHTILFKDSTAIISYFNHFLDSAFYNSSDTIILKYNNTFIHFFNRYIVPQPWVYGEVKVDKVSSDKCRQSIKNNLSIDLFSYSPDKSKLFIIMTYEVGEEPTEANALALIGERNDNQIILYRYGCCFRNDYGVVNKQYALYKIITEFEDKDRQSPDNANPLKKSFWNTGWFEKVLFNNTEKYRYQLDDYAYKWNEEKKYNERVTAEVEHFIVIDK